MPIPPFTKPAHQRSVLGLLLILAVAGIFLLATGRLSRPGTFIVAMLHPAATNAAAARIVPHRALYDLHLTDTRSGGEVTAASGQMMFVWGDSCDGWTVDQHLDMTLSYGNADDQRIRSTLATWEAKDGSHMDFRVRRKTDNDPAQIFQGGADLRADGIGLARYTTPDGQTKTLPAGTIFPTTHTLQLLSLIEKGQQHLVKTVFDGADENGFNEVSAFIGKGRQIAAPDGAKHADLRQGMGWPVDMAFFAPDNKTGMPDYEMKMTLFPNGVANDLLIDYGDFSVSATLRDVEPLPRPSC